MTSPLLPQELIDAIIEHLDPEEYEGLQSLLACGLASRSTLTASRGVAFRVMTITPELARTVIPLVVAPKSTISLCIRKFRINRSSLDRSSRQLREETERFANDLDAIIQQLPHFCGAIFSSDKWSYNVDIRDLIQASHQLCLVSELSLAGLRTIRDANAFSRLLGLFPHLYSMSLVDVSIYPSSDPPSPPAHLQNKSFVIEVLMIQSSSAIGYLQWLECFKRCPVVEIMAMMGSWEDNNCKYGNELLGLVRGNLHTLRMIAFDSRSSGE